MNESRVPKREWFGTGPKQHDCWKVIHADDNTVLYDRLVVTSPPDYFPGCECCTGPTILFYEPGAMPKGIDLDGRHLVIPIDKTTGEPIDWSFLEGK